MKVQCQICKDVFDDGMDPEGVLVPYIGLPQVTCPKCVARLRMEMCAMTCYDTEAFANKPIRKFIREFCCESQIVMATSLEVS
jgi:hypothetical protein